MTRWFVIVAALVCFLAVPGIAAAEEKIIDLPISSITAATDRNGNPYTRVIVLEGRKLQGIDYEVGVPTMAFGAAHEEVATLKKGDNLKALVSETEFQGRKNYNIIKVLQ